LENANLRGAEGLTIEQVLEATDWQSAEFDPEFRNALEAEHTRRSRSGA
jgi:hypothetical protein